MGGRAKEVKYYNNRYCGNMPEEQCKVLDEIIYTNDSDEDSYISDFRHIIYNNPDSVVTDFIEEMDSIWAVDVYNKPELPNPYGTLRDEQTLGVGFMFCANRCILGDSVGMGKTVEIAGVLNYLDWWREKNGGKPVRCLFLTEKSIASQVRTELVKFTGNYYQYVPSGEKKVIERFVTNNPFEESLRYGVVGTHALLSTASFIQWLELCRTYGEGFPFDVLVVDESSVLGGTSTQAVRGFKAISKYIKNIYFLNATPFDTNLMTFYNQLNLLDSSLLPTKNNFTKEYCIMDCRGMYPRPTGKYKNQSQFKRLVGYRYFARTRRDKGAVMSDCDGRIILSDLSKVQKEWLQKSQLHRLVYDCPSHIDPNIEFNRENVPKLGSLEDLLNHECADAGTVIVFVHFKEAQKHLSEWLTRHGYSNRVLNGETNSVDRQSIIQGFKNNEFRVLLTNVQKGLNFGNCDYCIFYSFDPNPSAMIQFEGRITRDFDIIGKHIYILCSRGSEYKTLSGVVRDRAKATADFTNTDFSVIMDILLGGDER